MNKLQSTDDWMIYNCHIHTFTKKNTPRQFIKFVLADSEIGKINWGRIPLYILFILIYLIIQFSLAKLLLLLSTNDVSTQPIYSFVLLLQAILLIPLVLLIIILLSLGVILLLQIIIDGLIKVASGNRQLIRLKKAANRGQSRVMRSNLLISLLVGINPATNDIFERTARFLKIASNDSQKDIFDQIEIQYPKGKTAFVVLPMDMQFMKLGKVDEGIDKQHGELLDLAQRSNGMIIPFYAVDPRHDDIVDRVNNNLAMNKFRGIKIYPGLGFDADHQNLMEIYKLCIKGGYPVITHCSPGGVWQYGLTAKQRRTLSHPNNYKRILDQEKYRTLKLCLAHFGGAEEWIKHLKGRARPNMEQEEAWVNIICEMIASQKYPNLYTDISYTVFTPKVKGLHIDLVDYLKVLLSNPLIRKRVLFGSDYYMVERENISEKEASILLRSHLGEDLYKQIAYTNPREFLGIDPPLETTSARRKKTTKG